MAKTTKAAAKPASAPIVVGTNRYRRGAAVIIEFGTGTEPTPLAMLGFWACTWLSAAKWSPIGDGVTAPLPEVPTWDQASPASI